MSEEEAKEVIDNYFTNYMNENPELALAVSIVLKALEKKDYLIHTMEAEFNRLEDLEDNTDMLKMELEKKDKIIQEMTKYIDKITEEIAREEELSDFGFCNNKCLNRDEDIDCKSCIKEYFIKLVEDK